MICRNSCLPTTCLALFPEKLLNPLTTNMHCPQTGRYLQLLCVTVPAQTCVTAVTIHEYAAITSFSAVLCTLPKNAQHRCLQSQHKRQIYSKYLCVVLPAYILPCTDQCDSTTSNYPVQQKAAQLAVERLLQQQHQPASLKPLLIEILF